MNDTTNLAQALRELFETWLESRPSFRTTVEVQAAWEGWKANTAVAAMLAAHESRAQPAGAADGIPNDVYQLARRCLWIAFVWNDHNFEAANIEARRECAKHGIRSFEEANSWMDGLDVAAPQLAKDAQP